MRAVRVSVTAVLRQRWRGAAISIGVFLVTIPTTLLLANLIGAWPARAAARTEAAVVLRTE